MPNSGLDTMIDMEKVEVLSQLYKLYSTVSTGIPILKRALKDSIARRGKIINESSVAVDFVEGAEQVELDPKGKGKAKAPVNSVTPATEWVERVLDLKDRFDSVWRKAFKSDREVEIATNEVASNNTLRSLALTTYLGFRIVYQPKRQMF